MQTEQPTLTKYRILTVSGWTTFSASTDRDAMREAHRYFPGRGLNLAHLQVWRDGAFHKIDWLRA